jgi:hypothetical protein
MFKFIVIKRFGIFLGLGVFVLLIATGTLWSTRVLNNDLSINKVKLITDIQPIKDAISQHQKDARYFPYRLRLVIFNDSVYGYQVIRNISGFWNLSNINRIILLANLYPIFLGLKILWNEKKLMWWACVLGIVTNSIVIGFNKMVDARSATWFILPILGYLVIRGIHKVNIRIYVSLLVLSILLCL